MLPFDASTTNIIITVVVVALFAFFIILLIKLKPSTETRESRKIEVEVERQRPFQASPIAPQNQPPARIEAPSVAEKPLVAVSPTTVGTPVQTRQESPTPAPTISESRDFEYKISLEKIPKGEKTVAQAKTGPVSSKKDCLHHFGYLRTFPKNSPIPDECFGCEKIVDCLVANKKSR